jgi:hypothetical protein
VYRRTEREDVPLRESSIQFVPRRDTPLRVVETGRRTRSGGSSRVASSAGSRSRPPSPGVHTGPRPQPGWCEQLGRPPPPPPTRRGVRASARRRCMRARLPRPSAGWGLSVPNGAEQAPANAASQARPGNKERAKKAAAGTSTVGGSRASWQFRPPAARTDRPISRGSSRRVAGTGTHRSGGRSVRLAGRRRGRGDARDRRARSQRP